ncbi:hypothetical protein CP556_13215 [Natrinema sp. CBA1119]|uniref:hypothetical protein n=1 Tax=Natrinema sp. CBA1119 TaxID=1608465 RepID=UPI000BF93C5F|nr:hypothetical protein [Natrinema sp. CBA1119]PGF16985.1 hypothetical protein CP556_13215 [Natrinema sp. CBA1119]
MSENAQPAELPAEIREAVPDWDDEYLDRVSDRLMYNYDLEKDRRVGGERWDLYGEMRVLSQKQFFHPALSYADHEAEEFLFVRHESRPTVAELERLVDLGHELADERVVADEEHFGTDFTFVLAADELPDDVREFVAGFRDRTLLKFGYHGHYEINLLVVVPEVEAHVASEAADIVEAFTLWDDVSSPEEGFLSRFAKRFWR